MEMAQVYGRLLELPVVVVLAVLWFAGALLEVLCVLVLYLAGAGLLQALAGF